MDHPEFDFTALLNHRDRLGRHSRRFPRIAAEEQASHHPLTVDQVLARHTVDGIAWANEISKAAAHVCQSRTFGAIYKKAVLGHQAVFAQALSTLSHAITDYANLTAPTKGDTLTYQQTTHRLWATLGNELDYFRTQLPHTSKGRLPGRSDFDACLPALLQDATAQLQQPTAQPRTPTISGERLRARHARGEFDDHERPRFTYEGEARAASATASPDRSIKLRQWVADTPDTLGHDSWYRNFQACVRTRAAMIKNDFSGELQQTVLDHLRHAGQALDRAFIGYTDLLMHNHDHPQDHQDASGLFQHLAESVQRLLLPDDLQALPTMEQFQALRAPMEQRAEEVLGTAQQNASGAVSRLSNQRNHHDGSSASNPSMRR